MHYNHIFQLIKKHIDMTHTVLIMGQMTTSEASLYIILITF